MVVHEVGGVVCAETSIDQQFGPVFSDDLLRGEIERRGRSGPSSLADGALKMFPTLQAADEDWLMIIPLSGRMIFAYNSAKRDDQQH